MNKLNATNLKTLLWETINKVKAGKCDIEEANAISAGAREILRATKVQMQVTAYTQDELTDDMIALTGVSKKTKKVGTQKQLT